MCVCVCVCVCGLCSGGVIAVGLPLHSPRVKAEVKTNEVPIRASLCEGDVYFCLSSLFLLFAGRLFSFSSSLFASHSLSRLLPPSTPLLAQQARTHTDCITHTHTHTLVHGNRGVWLVRKSHVCVIWMPARRRITQLLCILMLFSCCFLFAALSLFVGAFSAEL